MFFDKSRTDSPCHSSQLTTITPDRCNETKHFGSELSKQTNFFKLSMPVACLEGLGAVTVSSKSIIQAEAARAAAVHAERV
jgi:hypothetical protein